MVISRFTRKFLAFKQETKGVAAIEFALIFPLMVAMYFGVAEICDNLEAKRKVENVANMAGQLVSQATVADDAYLTNVFKASSMAFEPYDSATLKVAVTAIQRIQDNNNEWHNKVVWSKGNAAHGVGYGKNDIIDPPTGLLNDGLGIIMTEVEYKHTSVFSYYFTGSMTFSKTFWSHPRYVPAIPFE